MIDQLLCVSVGVVIGWVVFGKDYLRVKNKSYSCGFRDGLRAGRKGG